MSWVRIFGIGSPSGDDLAGWLPALMESNGFAIYHMAMK
jgi:hypothetical protein